MYKNQDRSTSKRDDLINPRVKSRRKKREPVAIIGIGCRFPGANGPQEFWQMLRGGIDAVKEVPKERFDIDAVYDPKPGTAGKTASRRAGLLDNIDKFDAEFFGISPREALQMDPQQRLLLEVSWEALEDAGQPLEKLAGSRTGVFIGNCFGDYEDLMYQDPENLSVYSAVGNFRCSLPGRISYVLDLRGPSLMIDAGCAASLAAVHLAAQSIRNGECELAIAGGVNLVLHPQLGIAYSNASMLSPDGNCKAFDWRANGFVRGEAAAVVLLKPLSLALADGDPIYATVIGTAVNEDGYGNGLFFSPSVEGHRAVLEDAYQSAGVAPAKVQYVETHGTGTRVGDPTEAEAIGTFFRQRRPASRPLAIGSVKSNMGHAEGAAGIAGLIKVALSLKNREIPPSLHVERPNPDIPWDELRLKVQRELTPWPVKAGEVARAGVSSLGISGTNAHVVLEEPPGGLHEKDDDCAPRRNRQLLVLSARSQEALRATAQSYQEFLRRQAADDSSLYDICHTASLRRTHHQYRLSLAGSSFEECAESLDAFLLGESRSGMSSGEVPAGRGLKVAFVFSGHGAQWRGMGRKLFDEEPVFRETIQQCDRAIAPYTDWSLIEEIHADEASSNLHRNDVIQVMLFAIQVALAALWRSWGVRPDAVVGHSMGEVAAAYAAGALTLDDAARIICHRSLLLEELRGKGGMVLAELSLEQTAQVLTGYEDRVSIGVSNSPTSTVISGDPQALKEIVSKLEQSDVFCRWVKADAAGHSPQVEPLCPRLISLLEGIRPMPESVAFYSAFTTEMTGGEKLDPHYWAGNMRNPVLFSLAVQKMQEDGINVFIEVAAHPILQMSIRQVADHTGKEANVIISTRRKEDDGQMMLGSLGSLFVLGYPVDWQKLYAGGRHVDLPKYAWQRERFWVDNIEMPLAGQKSGTASRASRPSAHPLLDTHLESPAHQGTHFWETGLSISRLPAVDDHRIHNRAVLPATSYLDMVQGAVSEAFPGKACVLEDVEFKAALFIPDEGERKVQLIISPGAAGTFSFQFYSQQEGAEQNETWTLNAGGTIRLAGVNSQEATGAFGLESEQFSRLQSTSGIDYQQVEMSVKGASQVWRRDGEAISQVSMAELLDSQSSRHATHPGILDACLRTAMAAFPQDDERFKGFAFMPVGLRRLRSVEALDSSIQILAVIDLDSVGDAGVVESDVFILNQDGEVQARLEGLRWKRVILEGASQSGGLDDWLYELRWETAQASQQAKPADGTWLIFTDASGVGLDLAEQLRQAGQSTVLVSGGPEYKVDGQFDYQINPSSAEDYQRLLADVCQSGQQACRGIVHLWGLDAAEPQRFALDPLNEAHDLNCGSVIRLVQALARAGLSQSPRLMLVTRGSQAVTDAADPVQITQSTLWGLGRVIGREHPEFRCKRIDLDPDGVEQAARSLINELWVEDGEDEIALRQGARHVPRLVRCSGPSQAEKSLPRALEPVLLDGNRSVRLYAENSSAPDGLVLREVPREQPGPGQVEIEVCATGLSFKDAGMAGDLLHAERRQASGFECAGRIAAIGEGVNNLSVGDEVIAISFSSLGTFAMADARLTAPKPLDLSFEQAATVPLAFLTAHYSLCEMGRLRNGESVLIHAASAGAGLAAIQIARRFGAKIFATAASHEHRSYLKSLGIEHVLDGGSFEFADEIMRLTDGEGVDLVLNSLAGEFIPRSLSALKARGRFVEIGSADSLQNSRLDMGLLSGNKSFCAVDLDSLFRQEPAACGVMLSEIMDEIKYGSLKPLPVRAFAASEMNDAFELAARAEHIGKVAIGWQGHEVWVERPRQAEAIFRSDSTYLVTGGLGGIGLTIAKWMVEQGARHLALTGRSGASASAQETIAEMQGMGAEVAIIRADVSDQQQVARLLEQVEVEMPPLRGIIHSAALFDGGVLLQLDVDRFKSVLAPKAGGAWNLHALTWDKPLDFFVLMSSAASLLGPPAEAGYVAANSFLDAFAHYRRAQGLACLSINWGAWGDTGRALVDPERKRQLEAIGLGSITAQEGLAALGEVMKREQAQIAVMQFDAERWCDHFGKNRKEAMLSHLIATEEKSGDEGEASIRDLLLGEAEGQRRGELLESFVREQLAQVLKISPSRLDSSIPLNRQGLDSLMSIELRNRLESQLDISLSATLVWKYPTVAALVPHLAEKLGIVLDGGQPSHESSGDQEQDILMAQIKELSETELGAALASRLQALEEI